MWYNYLGTRGKFWVVWPVALAGALFTWFFIADEAGMDLAELARAPDQALLHAPCPVPYVVGCTIPAPVLSVSGMMMGCPCPAQEVMGKCLAWAPQERRWHYIRAGCPQDYHGVAVHPRHLSWWERNVLHVDRHVPSFALHCSFARSLISC